MLLRHYFLILIITFLFGSAYPVQKVIFNENDKTLINDDTSIVKEIVLIVTYEELFEEKIVHSEALFFSIAATEIIMSVGLGYWTTLIRKEKVYL